MKRKETFFNRLEFYTKKILVWNSFTLDLLNNLDNIKLPPDREDYKKIFSVFYKKPPEEKKEKMSFILDDKDGLSFIDNIYIATRGIYYIKNGNFKTSCCDYASVVSTFSRWVDPENQTDLFLGLAIKSKAPNKKEIGEIQDNHLWVKINDKLIDNSNIDGSSYIDHMPFFRFNFSPEKQAFEKI